MDWKAKWIKPAIDMGDVVPVFKTSFLTADNIKIAKLYITSLGVYEAHLNNMRIGKFILAPGWTTYAKRLQYQEYDVTNLLTSENDLTVSVGKGWYRSRLVGWQPSPSQKKYMDQPCGLLAELHITYSDGHTEIIGTDNTWKVSESNVRYSEIYDGEYYDANTVLSYNIDTDYFDGPSNTLIAQQGEEIREKETLSAARIFTTPTGELVVDFGQNLTGYVVTSVDASAGDIVDLSFAEVMDKNGNFYTDNYRSAKATYHYVCKDGKQIYKPKHTFWGFRYIRINEFPGGPDKVTLDNFSAIALYSDMKQTGSLSCSNPMLNRLFDNIFWGQRGNFVDVPTDCPQRDERLGWTGDAQVFIKTACLNYDAEKFFTKWLADMAAEQWENGYVGHVIPDILQHPKASTAWGDAATICPWEVYLAYGNKEILENQFTCMHKWVDYITTVTTTPYLWTGGEHYGDWLGLDAPSGSYKGSTREDFIASAFYAHSTSLVIKAGKVLGKDVSYYETLYKNIVDTFRKTYTDYRTQTECILAAHFHLVEDCQKAADQLAQLVIESGTQLKTGFVGTPYILHVLSNYGYTDLAYSLLLRKEYPSWLYPITKGATTIWEHWDGIMENGDFWSADMNSFNHYAYGSVADWIYMTAAGIRSMEEYPGYSKVIIAPHPDARLDWLTATLDTRHGLIRSAWKKVDGMWRYDITTPVDTEIIIDEKSHQVKAGDYCFYSIIK